MDLLEFMKVELYVLLLPLKRLLEYIGLSKGILGLKAEFSDERMKERKKFVSVRKFGPVSISGN